uniref:TPX2 domain-containing protein n=1 Tax=Angiostrongylus cantonensis TaxID=6313 RepID=A0A0K0CY87_ANGCA
MCRPRIRQKSLTSPNLPTAVVIQPKDGEDEEKRETKPKDGSGRAECKHNSNRHFPSKTVTFELDVKKAEVEKQLKERERGKAAKKSAAAMVSVPLDAPPTYAESKKVSTRSSHVTEPDVILLST